MKKQTVTTILSMSLLLTACSSNDVLDGKREQLIIEEVNSNKEDKDLSYTAINTDEVLATPGSVVLMDEYTRFKFAWNSTLDYSANKESPLITSPVSSKDKVFCMDASGILYALSKNTGKRIWRISLALAGKDGQIGGAIAYNHGIVIATTSFAECFAINPENGQIIWRKKLSAACKGNGITVANGKVYALSNDSSLSVLDIHTGAVLWSHSGIRADAMYLGNSGVVTENGVVYLAYPSGEVYALSETTGAQLWDTMVSRYSPTNATLSISHPRANPIVSGNLLYITLSNDQLIALDKNTGETMWSKDYGGHNTPVVPHSQFESNRSSISVLTTRAELVCLNKNTGKLRWKTSLDKSKQWLGPIFVEDLVLPYFAVFAQDGTMVEISAFDGKILRSRQLIDGDLSVAPYCAADGEPFFAQNDDGQVVAAYFGGGCCSK